MEKVGYFDEEIFAEERKKEKIPREAHGGVQQTGGGRLRVKTDGGRRRTQPARRRGKCGEGRRRPEKRGVIGEMRAKATRERVIQRLYETALGRANDAVKLAYCQEPTEEEIKKLDLGAVAEFRRSNLGSVEIRFIDRVKALQALAGMLEGEGGEAEAFFRAMVQAEEGP